MTGVDVASPRTADGISLRDVEWRIEPREFWVVGGLLSSGKTDLCLTAAGALPPARGSLRLFGEEVGGGFTQGQVNQRLRVGLVQDGGLLFRHLNVAENIALPLQYHHDATLEDVLPRLSAWLESTGLHDRALQPAGSVGRNWAQRAGLARACILEPELLVLDNPLTGLDPRHARWWLDTLGLLWRGHPLVSHRPMTLVVTCDDFRPWIAPGRRYALLRGRRFEPLSPTLDPGELPRLLLDEAP
ncbi:MAG TPA: hypothetical protein DCM86_03655 [Verrucomicrobiales bacterium]|nr:hypothetical protein [Verrucomicrobiales bacterium]